MIIAKVAYSKIKINSVQNVGLYGELLKGAEFV
jgi:hypothetical protein